MKKPSISLVSRPLTAALLFSSLLSLPAVAQTATPPAAASPSTPAPAANDAPPVPQSDATVVGDKTPIDRTHRKPSQNVEEAWSMLKTAVADQKKSDDRVESIGAIGTIQGSPVAHKIISDALNDPNLDVRIAAIIAVGTLRDKGLLGKVREMMADKEPQIVFTAAITLWKLGDKSGEDILMSVAQGDRQAGVGMLKGSERKMNKDLHNPTKLAEMGARQGAGYILGPFGYGIAAWDYARQHPGENPRVSAITLLDEEKTPNVHTTLILALGDKDAQVRTAAARALGSYRTKDTATSLLAAFDDPKLSVRLVSAASYIRINSAETVRRVAVKK
ncbi:MAG TPA: HEAT repeat domain-containing protein [Acidobacteriaceae bacterium]